MSVAAAAARCALRCRIWKMPAASFAVPVLVPAGVGRRRDRQRAFARVDDRPDGQRGRALERDERGLAGQLDPQDARVGDGLHPLAGDRRQVPGREQGPGRRGCRRRRCRRRAAAGGGGGRRGWVSASVSASASASGRRVAPAISAGLSARSYTDTSSMSPAKLVFSRQPDGGALPIVKSFVVRP